MSKLRSEYRLKYAQDSKTRQQVRTPLICGTFINAHCDGARPPHQSQISNMSFDRKLRMMRADLYALLSISTMTDFFSEPLKTTTIKQGILKFLEGEFNERVRRQEVFSRLQGWNKLLYQKCNQSQILQIHAVNQPDCVRNAAAKPESVEHGCDHYAFAAFVEPGYHQFIIYDPDTDRAFCQEMMVDFNHQQALYPELPQLIP